jgi:hypothetical protein
MQILIYPMWGLIVNHKADCGTKKQSIGVSIDLLLPSFGSRNLCRPKRVTMQDCKITGIKAGTHREDPGDQHGFSDSESLDTGSGNCSKAIASYHLP